MGRPPSLAEPSAPATLRRRAPRLCLAVASLAYLVVVVALNGLQVRALAITKGIDQTYLCESLVNTVHGRFFVTTHAITNLGGWGKMDHFWPAMLLLVPVVAALQNVMALYVINGLCLTLTGIALFAVARDSLGSEWLALLSALALWTMPETYYCAVSGCWPEVWAMPFLALMVLFYLRRRALLFALVAVPFMGCMEQMLVFVALFALLELLGRREVRWVALPAGLAALWVVVLAVFANSFAAGRFFTHPFSLEWPHLLRFLSALFLSAHRSPLLYLALLWPPALLLSLPPSVVIAGWNLDLALRPANDGMLRYGFFIYLFMAVGGVIGLGALVRVVGRRLGRLAPRVALVGLLAVLSAHLVALAGMAPQEAARYSFDAADQLVWDTLRSLPRDARVAANREISYAFVGRAAGFIDFFETPSLLRVKEYYFDPRNVPTGAWRAEDRFQAMGRHTPAVFVLDRRGGRFTVARALWADPNFRVTRVGCGDVNGDGREDIVLLGPERQALVYAGSAGSGLDFAPGVAATLDAARLVAGSVRSPLAELPLGDGWRLRLEADRRAVTVWSPGTAAPVAEQRFDGYVEEVVRADLEGDGREEALLLDSQRYEIWVLRRGAKGSCRWEGPIPAPPIPTSLCAADLDGDGEQEIVVTKSQVLPDIPALERFLTHERVDHLFWYRDPNQPVILQHFGEGGKWSAEQRGGLLHLSRRRQGLSGG